MQPDSEGANTVSRQRGSAPHTPLSPPNPLHANPYLAIDLAYGDESPAARVRTKSFFRNAWASLKRWRLFVSLACVDIRVHPGSYVLSFFAVAVVVMLCVIMLSILATSPVIFQRLAEASAGVVDFTLVPGMLIAASPTLNYTAIREQLPLDDDAVTGFHAPRIALEATLVGYQECMGNSPKEWWSWNESQGSACELTPRECLQQRCGAITPSSIDVVALRPALEARMGYNTEVNIPEPGPGEVLISSTLSATLQLHVGDRVMLLADWGVDLTCMIHNNSPAASFLMMPAVVAGVLGKTGPKFAASNSLVIVPYDGLPALVAGGSRPDNSAAQLDKIASTPPDECVTTVNFNLPPSQRDWYYRSAKYDTIRQRVSEVAGRITEPFDARQVTVTAPILAVLSDTQMFSTFIGMVVSVVILALVFFSVVLIYSLINVNLETRTYQLGVQRLLGFTRGDLVLMVLINTYFFAIPGWLAGLGFGQLVYLGVRQVFFSLVEVKMDLRVAGSSVGWATLAGLAIPLLASFFPILSLVALSLPAALDASRRPGASGVIYSVRRKDRLVRRGVLFALGLLVAVFGVLIYFLFPLSLIKMNLTLMFYIFFGVLIGMLIGLTLLALNVENVLELSLLYAFFFWESTAVFNTVRKSLVAHRMRNRKTTLMYALSVAFVVFISVAFDIQFTALRFDTYQAWGTDVRALRPAATLDTIALVQKQLSGYLIGRVQNAPELTYEIGKYTACRPLATATLRSPGRYAEASNSLKTVPPNFFEVMQKRFLRVDKQLKAVTERYSLAGALYTSEYGHRVLMSSSSAKKLALKNIDETTLVHSDADLSNYTNAREYLTTVVQVAATLDAAATVSVSPYPSDMGDFVTSLPLAARVLGEPYMSVRCLTAVKLSLNGGADRKYCAAALQQALFDVGVSHIDVDVVESDTSSTDDAGNILNLFLIFVLIMVLIICFFSLMSSMTSNVFNSAKEIGIFLCLGMSRWQLYRVYMWEAFLLVVSSGLLGLVVGMLVAYMMQMQNALLTQLPLPFTFPYIQLLILVGIGLLSAFLASFSPVHHLLRMPSVTHILRRTVSS